MRFISIGLCLMTVGFSLYAFIMYVMAYQTVSDRLKTEEAKDSFAYANAVYAWILLWPGLGVPLFFLGKLLELVVLTYTRFDSIQSKARLWQVVAPCVVCLCVLFRKAALLKIVICAMSFITAAQSPVPVAGPRSSFGG